MQHGAAEVDPGQQAEEAPSHRLAWGVAAPRRKTSQCIPPARMGLYVKIKGDRKKFIR